MIDIDLEWIASSTWFWIDVRPLVRHSTSSVRHLMKEPTRLELHLRWVVTGELKRVVATIWRASWVRHNLWWKENTLGFEVKRRVRARERVSVYDVLVAPVSKSTVEEFENCTRKSVAQDVAHMAQFDFTKMKRKAQMKRGWNDLVLWMLTIDTRIINLNVRSRSSEDDERHPCLP